MAWWRIEWLQLFHSGGNCDSPLHVTLHSASSVLSFMVPTWWIGPQVFGKSLRVFKWTLLEGVVGTGSFVVLHPRSPSLTSLYFFFWGYVKDTFHRKKTADVTENLTFLYRYSKTNLWSTWINLPCSSASSHD
jgi:hypothetical protein